MAEPLVPEADPADAAEQHEPAGGELVGEAAGPGPSQPVPESDAQEQSIPVQGQSLTEGRGPRPVDADEADWQEQSMVEPIDEDEVR